MTRFARWLSDWMFWMNISQRDLANEIGVSQSSISSHITGKRKPTYRAVKRYCTYFGEPDVEGVYELTLLR